jgi:hypothetical protein
MPLDQTQPGGPSSDQIAEILRQYRSQRRVVDEENGVLGAFVKRAKAEGMNIDALRWVVRAIKKDPEVVIAFLRDAIRYATILKMDIPQGSLFDGWTADVTSHSRADDELWEAGDAGYYAGRHGHPLEDNPYPPGSPLAAAYATDWHKGQAAIAREMGETGAQITARRGAPEDEAPMTPRAADSGGRPRAPRQPAAASPRVDSRANGRRGSAQPEAS